MSRKTKRDNARVRNPVARYANKFNRPTVFADAKQYRRNEKHKSVEPFAMALPA